MRRTALVGVRRNEVTHPVLWVELDRSEEFGRSLFDSIGQLRSPILDFMMCEAGRHFPHTRRITTFLCHPEFPVDARHNSKIFREQLALEADRVLGKSWIPGDET